MKRTLRHVKQSSLTTCAELLGSANAGIQMDVQSRGFPLSIITVASRSFANVAPYKEAIVIL
jgi:hypothetical protein